jgi:hypothetical protein
MLELGVPLWKQNKKGSGTVGPGEWGPAFLLDEIPYLSRSSCTITALKRGRFLTLSDEANIGSLYTNP